MEIVPSFLLTSEEIIPIVVDLPAPFGPSKAKKSPLSTFKSMPFSVRAHHCHRF